MSGFVGSSANCSVCCSHNQALQPVMPLISHGHHGTRHGDPRGRRPPTFSREIAIFPLHCFNMEFPITLGATIAQINQLIGAGHTNKSMGNNMHSIKHSCSVYYTGDGIFVEVIGSMFKSSKLPCHFKGGGGI